MKKFERELAALHERLVRMGDVTESMVELAIGQIEHPRDNVHQAVIAREKQLDQMQVDIDGEAVRQLTVYSPVAADLRYLLTVMHVNTSLERIGDQAVNLCEDVQLLATNGGSGGSVGHHGRPLPKLQQMAGLVRTMVRETLDAFSGKDTSAAQRVRESDDLVDSLNDRIVREVLSDEVARELIKNPQALAGSLAQILLARSLERIADQSVNIAEDVIYMIKGSDVRHEEETAHRTDEAPATDTPDEKTT